MAADRESGDVVEGAFDDLTDLIALASCRRASGAAEKKNLVADVGVDDHPIEHTRAFEERREEFRIDDGRISGDEVCEIERRVFGGLVDALFPTQSDRLFDEFSIHCEENLCDG